MNVERRQPLKLPAGIQVTFDAATPAQRIHMLSYRFSTLAWTGCIFNYCTLG